MSLPKDPEAIMEEFNGQINELYGLGRARIPLNTKRSKVWLRSALGSVIAWAAEEAKPYPVNVGEAHCRGMYHSALLSLAEKIEKK